MVIGVEPSSFAPMTLFVSLYVMYCNVLQCSGLQCTNHVLQGMHHECYVCIYCEDRVENISACQYMIMNLDDFR